MLYWRLNRSIIVPPYLVTLQETVGRGGEGRGGEGRRSLARGTRWTCIFNREYNPFVYLPLKNSIPSTLISFRNPENGAMNCVTEKHHSPPLNTFTRHNLPFPTISGFPQAIVIENTGYTSTLEGLDGTLEDRT